MSGSDIVDAIRQHNDTFRAAGPIPSQHNRWVMTSGVLDLGPVAAALAIQSVCSFSDFDPDNDPYAEHDFGAFDLVGERLFWKIDYYNLTKTAGSPDPSDPAVTARVMTIMLASEY